MWPRLQELQNFLIILRRFWIFSFQIYIYENFKKIKKNSAISRLRQKPKSIDIMWAAVLKSLGKTFPHDVADESFRSSFYLEKSHFVVQSGRNYRWVGMCKNYTVAPETRHVDTKTMPPQDQNSFHDWPAHPQVQPDCEGEILVDYSPNLMHDKYGVYFKSSKV